MATNSSVKKHIKKPFWSDFNHSARCKPRYHEQLQPTRKHIPQTKRTPHRHRRPGWCAHGG